MDYHAGKCRLQVEGGTGVTEWECRIGLGEDGVVISPAASAEFSLDYSDIDRVTPVDWQVELAMYDGRTFTLYFLGSWYGQCVKDLGSLRSAQLTRNLLMLDADFEKAFTGSYAFVAADGAEHSAEHCRISLYRSSLVVESPAGDFFIVAYADIQSLTFDPGPYSLELQLDLGERLVFRMLGTRFGELQREIERLTGAMYDRTAAFLGQQLPDVAETVLRKLAVLLRQGKAVPKVAVESAAPGLWPRLEALLFTPGTGEPDPLRQACFLHLCGLAQPEHVYIGFRESWEAAGEPVYWFVVGFPAHGTMAVEVTNETGNATYVYRMTLPVDRAVRELSRAMVAVNFRRDVISASEQELAGERMARYRVALRKLEYVRKLRGLFRGKAAHTDEAAWKKRVGELLNS